MAGSPPSGKPQAASLVVGGCLVVGWIFLSAISRGLPWTWAPEAWRHGFAYEVANGLMPTETFLVFHLLGSLLLLGLLWWLAKGKGAVSVRWIFAVAIACRIVAMWGEPIHENDFYRYLWDGKSSLAGVNPYRFEPGALHLWENGTTEEYPDPVSGVNWRGREFTGEEAALLEILRDLREEDPTWFDRIGHQPVTTIYPPVAQGLFAVAALAPGWSAWGLKLVFACFDVATAWLLLSLLRRFGLPGFWVILYAWHPLVVKEFANSVHYDSVPVFFSVLALSIATRQGDTHSLARAAWIGVVVAAGFLAKYFTLLLLPLLLWWLARKRDGWRRLIAPEVGVGLLIFVLLVVLAFLPYLIWNEAGWERVIAGLSAYQAHWQYNPGVFALLNRGLDFAGMEGHFAVAKILSALLLVAVVVLVSWRRAENGVQLAGSAFVVMAALFVLSPTAFPWYFCWPLAFLVFRPRWSWMLLSVLLPMNYLDFQPKSEVPAASVMVGGFHVLSACIWIVFFLAWLCERVRRKSH